jgi:hypothetical protein
MPRRYELRLAGFAHSGCQSCHGTGRLGYNRGVDAGEVIPCPCIVYYETSRLKKEADALKSKQQRDSGPSET